mmetsp:Transcript_18211/g.69033  ORF Transcript_18211/g.69033 Transcript_18211/m.69033 type:complete len:293 (-) Transcript_18211:2685-3563(-)
MPRAFLSCCMDVHTICKFLGVPPMGPSLYGSAQSPRSITSGSLSDSEAASSPGGACASAARATSLAVGLFVGRLVGRWVGFAVGRAVARCAGLFSNSCTGGGGSNGPLSSAAPGANGGSAPGANGGSFATTSPALCPESPEFPAGSSLAPPSCRMPTEPSAAAGCEASAWCVLPAAPSPSRTSFPVPPTGSPSPSPGASTCAGGSGSGSGCGCEGAPSPAVSRALSSPGGRSSPEDSLPSISSSRAIASWTFPATLAVCSDSRGMVSGSSQRGTLTVAGTWEASYALSRDPA